MSQEEAALDVPRVSFSSVCAGVVENATTDEAAQKFSERLAVSRTSIAEWIKTAASAKDAYVIFTSLKTCKFCSIPCNICPHYSPSLIQSCMQRVSLRGKHAVMAYDILVHEMNGTIETRREGEGPAFLGIRRFIIPKDKREEFNQQGHVPEWSSFRPRDARFKHAVASWTALGWTGRLEYAMDESFVFVYDPVVRSRAITRNGVIAKVTPRQIQDRVFERGMSEEWPLFAAKRKASEK